MKGVVKFLVMTAIASGVLALAALIVLIIWSRPSKVKASDVEACRHYDNQAIMSKVIRAKSGDRSPWKSFSDAQDVAEKSGMLIDPDQISFGNDIWLVPFTQRTGQSVTEAYFGMLDCTTDNVEFSKK